MAVRSVVTFACALAILFAAPPIRVLAQNGTGIDAQENVFGATNIHAVTGHGRMSVGVSRDGDITVLSWPSPSLNDQLAYLSSNDLEARSMPRFGAPESLGLFSGIACDDGGGGMVSWFRDHGAWSIDQDYGDSHGPNPRTQFENASLGLRVTIVDAVAPTSDTLVRRIDVERAPSSAIGPCALLTYANLSPQPPNARVAELPVADWVMDGRNDYAAIWDARNDAVIHFHPNDQRVYSKQTEILAPPSAEWGPIGDALRLQSLAPSEIAQLASGLSESYSDGAWLVLTTTPPPAEHQVGFDGTPICEHIATLVDNVLSLSERFPGFKPPLDPTALMALRCGKTPSDLIAEQGWSYPADDPWLDLQDGRLEGADLAAIEAAEALRTELVFDGSGRARAAVVLGAGENLGAARRAVAAGLDPDAVVRASEEALEQWISGLRIPGEPGTWSFEVARRALINLRVGTDVASGAIVASIARQPPYYVDWPRDGAFFNVMLDASGQSALVDRRVARYSAWQRKQPVEPTPLLDPPAPVDPTTGDASTYPADAWEMNYYPDGTPAGTFRFEIDTTAFAVWTTVAHAGWVDEPGAYLLERWETIRSGAELLSRWRDDRTGLHAPAQEDDQGNHSQTLHGAITVFGALDMAARAARAIGRDTEAQAWEERASELADAMQAHFYDEAEQVYFMQESGRLPLQASGLVATGPTAWLVWPMTLYSYADPQVERQLARDLEIIRAPLQLESAGGLYYMKNTVSLAVAGRGRFDQTIDALPDVLSMQATPATGHYGEVMVVDNDGTEPRADQRVANPHLWEGALYYLTALAVEDPEAIRRYEQVLPQSQVRKGVSTTQDGGGCRCTVEPSSGRVSWSIVLLLLFALRGRLGSTDPRRSQPKASTACNWGAGRRRARRSSESVFRLWGSCRPCSRRRR
jgi:hypothetical protein